MRNTVSLDQKSTYLKEMNGVTPQHAGDCVTEHYYTVAEVARILNLSADKVRRMFQDELGVLVIGDRSTKQKRKYTTLRIPESVLRRVLRRMSNV